MESIRQPRRGSEKKKSDVGGRARKREEASVCGYNQGEMKYNHVEDKNRLKIFGSINLSIKTGILSLETLEDHVTTDISVM